MKTVPYLLLPCLLLAAPAPAQDVQPGSWNIEMALAIGEEKPPPSATTMCLNNLDEMVNAGSGCAAHTTSASGGHVEMSLSCDVNGLKMNGTGSLAVAPTRVDGTLNLTMQMAGDNPVPSVTTLHAVRLGDCTK
ncbi:MAG: DUF3617 family protein [Nevskia sp.]|nr:DUF3617 family protein [Nevskia sp.]